MINKVPNNNLPIVYQKAKIFVLPSLTEGVPRTILEAMSCGVPIISTNLNQLRELVKGCGFLVPTKNVNELTHAIDILLDNKNLWGTFSKIANRVHHEKYSCQEYFSVEISLFFCMLFDQAIKKT